LVESNRRPDKRYRFEQAQDEIAAKGGQIAAIMPDQQHFTAGLKVESHARFPILTDIDNGYAMSLNLAFWVGAEMQELTDDCRRLGHVALTREPIRGCCRSPPASLSAPTAR
jgi:hypothetical protein